MRVRHLALLLALAPSVVASQQTRTMVRSTKATTLGDSSLIVVSDTATSKITFVTKAASIAALRVALTPSVVDSATGAARAQKLTTARTIGGTSFDGTANIVPAFSDSSTGSARAQILTTARTIGGTSFNGSANITPALSDSATGSARSQTLTTARTLWGQSFNGSANITGSLTSVGDITGGASSMNLQAGTGASRTLTLSATNASSAATNSIALAADSTVTFNGKIVGADSLTFSAASPLILGGAGNMTIRAGTGNSRTLTLSTTTSAGNAKSVLVLGADSSSTFLGMTKSVGAQVTGSSLNSCSSCMNLRGSGTSNWIEVRSAASNTVATLGFVPASSNGSVVGPVGYVLLDSLTFAPSTDGLRDLGASGFAWRNIYGGAQFLGPLGSATAPTYSFTSALGAGLYAVGNATADSVRIATDSAQTLSVSGGASAKIIGGAGSMTVQCGTGNSRTCTFQSTTSAGTAKNTLVLGADSSTTSIGQFLGATMSAALPSFALSASPTTGIYRFGADTLGIATAGTHTLQISNNGSGGARITGGASDMIITAGTGNSRSMTLRTTTSGGSASSFLTGNPNQSANFTGTVKFPAGTAANPSLTITGDTTLGAYQYGVDTLGIATLGVHSIGIRGGASPTIFGGAGNMTIQAGTGASRTLTLQSTTSGSVAKNTLVLGADTSATFLGQISQKFGGSATSPGITFNGFSALGIGAISGGVDTMFFGHSNGRFLSFSFNSATPLAQMQGGATSLTILAGTGNNRSLTLQSSNSSGTATTFAQGGGDTLKLAGHLIATGLSSEGSTQSAVCVTNGGGQVFINAAATCTVSSARYKHDIAGLSPVLADSIVRALRPSTFTYNAGGLNGINFIAEQADSIDTRLASHDADGKPNSVNSEAVVAALTLVVQRQEATIKALTAFVCRVNPHEAVCQ